MDDPSGYLEFLGNNVHVIVDRPKGSLHPRHGFSYPVNYGYVPGTLAGDGSEIDAYVLGIDSPVVEYSGVCIAVILREDDDEHKLVVAPSPMTIAEIAGATSFVESHFRSTVVVG